MITIHRVRHLLSSALLTAALTIGLPGLAAAIPVHLSGQVDDVLSANPFVPAPFSEGDLLSGLFNVDVAPGGSFSASDLQSFSLSIGPALFDLDGSDFASFSGGLSTDGSQLTGLSFASDFVSVPGLAGEFSLGAVDPALPFSLVGTASASITTGSFQATVQPTAVPEPDSLALMLLAATALVGFGVLRRSHDRFTG